jgi:peroxiredoxin Q/BCP
MVKIGEKAPDFVLPSDEGEEVSLENFKGRRILIFFYPKANTTG